MSNVIELSITEIDTAVGGVSASQTAALQMSIPNKTMMAVPNVSAYSHSNTHPADYCARLVRLTFFP